MRSRIYEFAILHHPKPTEDIKEPKSVLVQEPTNVLANEEKEVAIRAARAIPDAFLEKLDEIEIIVRPF